MKKKLKSTLIKLGYAAYRTVVGIVLLVAIVSVGIAIIVGIRALWIAFHDIVAVVVLTFAIIWMGYSVGKTIV